MKATHLDWDLQPHLELSWYNIMCGVTLDDELLDNDWLLLFMNSVCGKWDKYGSVPIL